MRSTGPVSITLTEKVAKAVRRRVASGEYGSESEVVLEGLLALEEQEAAVEQWLRTEGVARFDAWQADPGRTVSARKARAAVKRHIRRRQRASDT